MRPKTWLRVTVDEVAVAAGVHPSKVRRAMESGLRLSDLRQVSKWVVSMCMLAETGVRKV